jgi:hypothetical protein
MPGAPNTACERLSEMQGLHADLHRWPGATGSIGLPRLLLALVTTHAALRQVGHDGLVGFPAVGELGRDVEVHRLGGRMGVEKLGDPGPGYDDARVPVPEVSTHWRPASRWNAVASRRPDSGCSTIVTSNSRPCSRLALSTVTPDEDSRPSCDRIACAWSRCAVAVREADFELLAKGFYTETERKFV